MTYFTWKETRLTNDCSSLEAMAFRFEESSKLFKKMAKEGFKLEQKDGKQIITHNDEQIFEEWGFISEETPYLQLKIRWEEPSSK